MEAQGTPITRESFWTTFLDKNFPISVKKPERCWVPTTVAKHWIICGKVWRVVQAHLLSKKQSRWMLGVCEVWDRSEARCHKCNTWLDRGNKHLKERGTAREREAITPNSKEIRTRTDSLKILEFAFLFLTMANTIEIVWTILFKLIILFPLLMLFVCLYLELMSFLVWPSYLLPYPFELSWENNPFPIKKPSPNTLVETTNFLVTQIKKCMSVETLECVLLCSLKVKPTQKLEDIPVAKEFLKAFHLVVKSLLSEW